LYEARPTEEQIQFGEEVTEYYLSKFVQDKLCSNFISDWQEEAGKQLALAKENKVDVNSLKYIVKLPSFYMFANNLKNFAKDFNSFTEMKPGETADYRDWLRPVASYYKPQSSEGSQRFYLMANDNNQLVELSTKGSVGITATSALDLLFSNPSHKFEIFGQAKAVSDLTIPGHTILSINHPEIVNAQLSSSVTKIPVIHSSTFTTKLTV